MRVLHVTHQYRPAIGGAERYITDVSEELAKRGHQVDVFTSRSVDYQTWRDVLPRFERLDGVNVYRFSSVLRTARAWRALAYGFDHYWRTGARRYEPFIFYGSGPICPSLFVAILARAHQYDLIHINQLHYSHSLLAYIAARARHLPIVLTPHLHPEQRQTYDIEYLRSVLRGSDAILAVTPAEQEFLITGRWNREVVVGGNSLRLEQFPPLDQQRSRVHFGLPVQSFVVLFLGRKEDYKGLDVCLSAFCSLRQQRSDVYLLAVGPETDYSRQLWSRYSGADGVMVRDAVTDDERLVALAACDVLAVPSVGEAFGIVYLEAWAYRKPVIGAKISSVSSFVSDGEDGFLIEPKHVDQLVEYLQILANNPALARQMGERGRAKLERRYTVERIADIVEGTYARVIRQHHTRQQGDHQCA